MAPQEFSATATVDLPVKGASGAQECYSWLSRWPTTANKWAVPDKGTFVTCGQESGVGFAQGSIFSVTYTVERTIGAKGERTRRVTQTITKTLEVVEATDPNLEGAEMYSVKFKTTQERSKIQHQVEMAGPGFDKWLQASFKTRNDNVLLELTLSQMWDQGQMMVAMLPFFCLWPCMDCSPKGLQNGADAAGKKNQLRHTSCPARWLVPLENERDTERSRADADGTA